MTAPPDVSDSRAPAPAGRERIVSLPIERIQRDRAQARTQFDEAALVELAASIAASGVIQPVVVQSTAENGEWRLIAGERRWRAAQRAGLAELPAIVRDDLSADEASVLGLIENLQRESLGVMDTARGLGRLGQDHGLTHDAIARRIGKSRVYVTNYLRLRQLAPAVQTLLDDGRLSLGHGKALAGLDGATQTTLARRAVARRASVRQLERWARAAGPEGQGPPAPDDVADDADLSAMERNLAEHLGNEVAIRYEPARRRGELRIAFHDLDEFEGLLARLGYRSEE